MTSNRKRSRAFLIRCLLYIFYTVCLSRCVSGQQIITNGTADSYLTIDQVSPLGVAQILSYDSEDNFLFSVNAPNLKSLNMYTQPQLPDVAYFMVGTGPIQLELWSPFGENGNTVVAPALLLAVNDWVVLSRNTSTTTGGTIATVNGNDTVTVKVVVGDFNSDWMAYCGENGIKCPDMVILGTTQIALHAAHGTIKPLDDLFTEYTQKQNSLLPDSFLKYTFYDYQWNEHWWAVPLLTDVRLTYYNRTTLRALNIKPPPPEGDWGLQWWNNWNWTMFLESARQVQKSGIGYGMDFVGQYDEETKLMNMISRDWQVDFFKTDETTCGLQNDAFLGILDNIIRPLWAPNNGQQAIANPLKLVSNISSFMDWLNTPVDQVNPTKVDPAGFCCDYDLWPTKILAGYRIDTPANFNYSSVWIKDWAINSTANWDNSTEIGVGLAPGQATFLGGSGLAISSTTEHQDLAWDFIQMVIGPAISGNSAGNYEYLNVLNEANGVFPPYETSAQFPPWTAPSFYTATQQIAHAVPMQYPHSTSPQVSSIEDNHVFRQMLFNMAFKNATNEQAVNQTCDLLKWLMAPDCSYQFWTITVADQCNPSTGNLDTTFSWTNTTPVCHNGVQMPSTYSIPCSYVDPTTQQGSAITTLNTFCAAVTIVYMILFAIYRETRIIRRASFMFCELALFGSLAIYCTIYLLMGAPTRARCTTTVWTLILGFSLLFGAFFVMTWRIRKIFHSKSTISLQITNWYLGKRLLIILAGEIIGLLILTLVSGGPQPYSYQTGTVPQRGDAIMQSTCTYGNEGVLVYIAVTNLLFIMYSVGLSVATWNVPTQYNESKYVISASYTVAFGAILVIPLIFAVSDPFARIILIGVCVDSGVLMSVSIFSVPKLLIAMKLRKKSGKGSVKGFWGIFGTPSRRDPTNGTYSSEKRQYEQHSGLPQRVTLSGNGNNLAQYDEDDDNDIQEALSPWVAPLQTHSLTDDTTSGASPHADSAICECAADDYGITVSDIVDNKRPSTSPVNAPAPSFGLRLRQPSIPTSNLALFGVVGNLEELFISGRTPVDKDLVYCPNCGIGHCA